MSVHLFFTSDAIIFRALEGFILGQCIYVIWIWLYRIMLFAISVIERSMRKCQAIVRVIFEEEQVAHSLAHVNRSSGEDVGDTLSLIDVEDVMHLDKKDQEFLFHKITIYDNNDEDENRNKTIAIKDIIYGFVYLTAEERRIVDTPHYKCLDDVEQLGPARELYPSCRYSRKEHSFGCCHVTTLVLNHLRKVQPELGITENDIRLLRMAALVHDLGHGTESHTLDHIFQHLDMPEWMKEHEPRGKKLFGFLAREETSIMEEEIRFIQAAVDGEFLEGHPRWKFMIVACKFTGLDTDKMDYIYRDRAKLGRATDSNLSRIIAGMRVVDDRITYANKTANDLYAMFQNRHQNYFECYRAPLTIRAEAIELDIAQILAKVYEWESICQDETSFNWRFVFTDSVFTSLPVIRYTPVLFNGLSPEKQEMIVTACDLYFRMKRRHWYPRVKQELVEGDSSQNPEMEKERARKKLEMKVKHGDESIKHASELEEEDASLHPLKISRQVSDPPQLYPAPYIHKFRYVCGVSNKTNFNPLDRIRCREKIGSQLIIRPLSAVLKMRNGSNPLFEKHEAFMRRD